jgi:hypothetical protein
MYISPVNEGIEEQWKLRLDSRLLGLENNLEAGKKEKCHEAETIHFTG